MSLTLPPPAPHTHKHKKDARSSGYEGNVFALFTLQNLHFTVLGRRAETERQKTRREWKNKGGKTCWQSVAIHKPLVPPTVCS